MAPLMILAILIVGILVHSYFKEKDKWNEARIRREGEEKRQEWARMARAGETYSKEDGSA